MNTIEMYAKIKKRVCELGWQGDLLLLMMDIESADLKFNMRLEDWINADDVNFMHDVVGITNNINRTTYPATDFNFFVPRFAGIYK